MYKKKGFFIGLDNVLLPIQHQSIIHNIPNCMKGVTWLSYV